MKNLYESTETYSQGFHRYYFCQKPANFTNYLYDNNLRILFEYYRFLIEFSQTFPQAQIVNIKMFHVKHFDDSFLTV